MDFFAESHFRSRLIKLRSRAVFSFAKRFALHNPLALWLFVVFLFFFLRWENAVNRDIELVHKLSKGGAGIPKGAFERGPAVALADLIGREPAQEDGWVSRAGLEPQPDEITEEDQIVLQRWKERDKQFDEQVAQIGDAIDRIGRRCLFGRSQLFRIKLATFTLDKRSCKYSPSLKNLTNIYTFVWPKPTTGLGVFAVLSWSSAAFLLYFGYLVAHLFSFIYYRWFFIAFHAFPLASRCQCNILLPFFLFSC